MSQRNRERKGELECVRDTERLCDTERKHGCVTCNVTHESEHVMQRGKVSVLYVTGGTRRDGELERS